MNKDLPQDDASYHYYDGDYPSLEIGPDRDKFLDLALRQGIAYDVPRYVAMAGVAGSPILELGSGTGRVTIPLARRGHAVTGVEIAPILIGQCREKLAGETAEVAARLTFVLQDVTEMDLPEREYKLALYPFNGLLLLDGFTAQMRALERIRDHLLPNGYLVLDAANPLILPLADQSVPVVAPARLNPLTGNLYQKFALVGRMDENQRQPLFGWYDEILPGGGVRRAPYAFSWRLIFRYEMELMLHQAGYIVDAVQGGHNSEPFTNDSPRMVVLARKR